MRPTRPPLITIPRGHLPLTVPQNCHFDTPHNLSLVTVERDGHVVCIHPNQMLRGPSFLFQRAVHLGWPQINQQMSVKQIPIHS